MNAENTKELRVIALLDGRPGHEKQTMGIIQALQKKVPVQVIPIKVKGFSFIDSLVQTVLLFLPYLRKGIPSFPTNERGDLVIGTGSRTHLPLLLYKKKYAIPAITCMAPARHIEHMFDLCCVPEHDGKKEKKNIMLTSGSPNCSQNKGKHRKDHGLILLGGIDVKSHLWNSEHVVTMVEKIIKSESKVLWTVSSSPRTPSDTVTMLKQLQEQYGNMRFFDYRDTPAGWVEHQYDKNNLVWVTADSISMIYEAITAGCQVGIMPMQWLRENSKFKRNENILLSKGLVTAFTSWERGSLNQDTNVELNEAQRCAERIIQTWWPENLQ
ncbi:MAG: ELM1/GtrOC1 family putative glycosyltransferase [Desulforhopalus sp.]